MYNVHIKDPTTYGYSGQPVGWCIADTEASVIIEIFLSGIKERSPTTTVRVVMTDDGKKSYIVDTYTLDMCTLHNHADNTGWSATRAVYSDIKHLLCYWHVDRYIVIHVHTGITYNMWYTRAWKNKLRAVKPENQVEMYQILSVFAKELDPSVFQKGVSSFIQLWIPIEPDFVKYFILNYQNRAGT